MSTDPQESTGRGFATVWADGTSAAECLNPLVPCPKHEYNTTPSLPRLVLTTQPRSLGDALRPLKLGEKARSGSEEAFMAALQVRLRWLYVFQVVAVALRVEHS